MVSSQSLLPLSYLGFLHESKQTPGVLLRILLSWELCPEVCHQAESEEQAPFTLQESLVLLKAGTRG